MLEHVDSTSIAASPDTVYDAACALDWLDPEIAVTRISDGGDGVSGSYRLRMHVLGSEHSAVLEVEAGADGRRVGFSSVDCKECTIDGMYLLEPSGSGTRVSLRMQARAARPLPVHEAADHPGHAQVGGRRAGTAEGARRGAPGRSRLIVARPRSMRR